MIGASKLLSTGVTVNNPYAVNVTPAFFSRSVPNGSYTTPLFVANVVGEVGPLEYLWEIIEGNGALTSTDSQSTSVRSGGSNTEVSIAIKCTVTDTGNANAQVSANVDINLFFGSQL